MFALDLTFWRLHFFVTTVVYMAIFLSHFFHFRTMDYVFKMLKLSANDVIVKKGLLSALNNIAQNECMLWYWSSVRLKKWRKHTPLYQKGVKQNENSPKETTPPNGPDKKSHIWNLDRASARFSNAWESNGGCIVFFWS